MNIYIYMLENLTKPSVAKSFRLLHRADVGRKTPDAGSRDGIWHDICAAEFPTNYCMVISSIIKLFCNL